MNNLSEEELDKTTGGDVNLLGAAAIVTGIIFVVGIIEGFVNPKKCR